MGRREKQNEIGLFLCVWDFWLEQMGGWWSHLFKRGSLKDIYWLMRKTRVISKYGWIGANWCLIFFSCYIPEQFIQAVFPQVKKDILIQVCFCEVILPWKLPPLRYSQRKPCTFVDEIKLQVSSSEKVPDNWAWGSDSALSAWH